jgi:short-subunit dehydrogenase
MHFSRAGTMDLSTARGMTPHKAARAILEGVAWEKRELILAKPTHQLAVYLRVLWPSLLDWMLRRKAEAETTA